MLHYAIKLHGERVEVIYYWNYLVTWVSVIIFWHVYLASQNHLMLFGHAPGTD